MVNIVLITIDGVRRTDIFNGPDKHLISKLKIKEMGSRFWFIIFYCLIEKWLSVGDFRNI